MVNNDDLNEDYDFDALVAKYVSEYDDVFTDFIIFGPRTCSTCGTTYPANAEYFSHDESARDRSGLKGICKACTAARERDKFANDPEYAKRRRAINAEWRRLHRKRS